MTNNTTYLKADDPRTMVQFIGFAALVIVIWVVLVPTVIAFIYGVTSWCLIKKFRHFRNYVILSAITANMLRLSLFEITVLVGASGLVSHLIAVRALFLSAVVYSGLIFYCWLIVMSYIFYMDFVKVLRNETRRRYLKSSLFAWGPPITVSFLYYGAVFYFYYDSSVVTIDMMLNISIVIFMLPLLVNLVIYILVLYSLFRSKDNTSAGTSTNKWRRFYISALIFVLSGVMMLPTLVE